jgi:hypothetical protein
MDSEVRPRFDKLADPGRLGRSQVILVVLCSLVVMADGFDTQSIAVAASAAPFRRPWRSPLSPPPPRCARP